MKTPLHDSIYGPQAQAEKRVGHGAEEILRKLEIENARFRDTLEYIRDYGMSSTKETVIKLAGAHLEIPSVAVEFGRSGQAAASPHEEDKPAPTSPTFLSQPWNYSSIAIVIAIVRHAVLRRQGEPGMLVPVAWYQEGVRIGNNSQLTPYGELLRHFQYTIDGKKWYPCITMSALPSSSSSQSTAKFPHE